MNKSSANILLKSTNAHDISVEDCSLVDETLENLRANNVNLSRVDLSRANLQGGHWRGCYFGHVNLDEVRASKLTMRLCDFEHVTARKASFCDSALENCNAQGCDFEGSVFTDTSLTDSNFNRASFASSIMTDVDAGYCDMRGVDFRSAVLVRCNFQDADLRGADFTGAKLDEVDFHGADITGALFDADLVINRIGETDDGALPTDFSDLISAVHPVVESLFKVGVDKGFVNGSKMTDELESLMKKFGQPRASKVVDSGFDNEITDLLNQAAEVGIGPLLDSLTQDGGEPPLMVQKMIEGLMSDMELGEGATTEDLLSALSSTLEDKGVKH